MNKLVYKHTKYEIYYIFLFIFTIDEYIFAEKLRKKSYL